MSSTFNHCALVALLAPTEPENPTPAILQQTGVDTPAPWIIETIQTLRSSPRLEPDVWVATLMLAGLSRGHKVQNVDGKAMRVLTEREVCLVMKAGWRVLLDTAKVNGLDPVMATCHLERQMRGVGELMSKIGLDVVMNENEAAFMKSLLGAENIAWVGSVLRHLGV